ncbi:hypothetical protein [Streptomyces sp. NPDC097619]|uniref:hypothetical protein n=1 Tax=Streptomyces sp. NPDC097619 TaxID=3157228 RepID=UPI0033265D47
MSHRTDVTNVKAQALGKAVELKEQVAGTASVVGGQLRTGAAKAAELVKDVKDKAPGPVLDGASRAADRLREGASHASDLAGKAPGPLRERTWAVAEGARSRRIPALAAATVVVFFLVRRARRAK